MAIRTAREVITDAFHKLGFISEDEGISAEQADRGIATLNDMMNGWEAEGIQYQHTDLGLDDRLNVPDQYIWSTQWMLVEALGAEYGKTLSDSQQRFVMGARTKLQAYYFKVPQAQIDEGIQNRRSWGYGTITRA